MTTPNTATAPTALRKALRTATVGSLAAVPLLLASPAFANHHDAGDDPGPGMSAAATILTYIGIPLAVFIGISLLVMAPGIAKGNRYRPHTLSWWASPVWFGGPRGAGEETADRALTGTSLAQLPAVIGEADQIEGGSSARW